MRQICVLGGGTAFHALLGEALPIPYDRAVKADYALAAVLRTARGAQPLRCRVLLLWGEEAKPVLEYAAGETVVSCGFSPRDTLTLSSIKQERTVLTVQRELRTLAGAVISPQDIPLPARWSALPPEERLLAAGTLLLWGAGL